MQKKTRTKNTLTTKIYQTKPRRTMQISNKNTTIEADLSNKKTKGDRAAKQRASPKITCTLANQYLTSKGRTNIILYFTSKGEFFMNTTISFTPSYLSCKGVLMSLVLVWLSAVITTNHLPLSPASIANCSH